MAHYAVLDENNIVTNVIKGVDEDSFDGELNYGMFFKAKVKRTSYNSRGGVHYDTDTMMPSGKPAFRKNYASIGFYYDEIRDAFIPPKKYSDWVLNETTCLWEPPIPYPDTSKIYVWDNTNKVWIYKGERTTVSAEIYDVPEFLKITIPSSALQAFSEAGDPSLSALHIMVTSLSSTWPIVVQS